MAYFLKKTKNKKGLYLQIYESHWDAKRGHTVNSSVKAIGYEHELKEKGIEDPVAHFKAQVDSMNEQRRAQKQADKVKKIQDVTPERHLGHFPLAATHAMLGVEKDFAYLELASGLRFSVFDLLSDLVYARAVQPCSKAKTYVEVVPALAGARQGYSLDQLYAGLGFLGAEYQKVIEIYNDHIARVFTRNTATSYFDCTNFFFEIDREDELRKKGPSKENRRDPIVGMGLLLDGDCIPIGMSIYPGNESEKPQIRQVVGELKRRGAITGKTVRVADKGLNCADNIADAILSGDGYLFSKSVKQLAEAEQGWALADEGWSDVADGQGGLAYRYKEVVDEFAYRVTDEDGKKKQVRLKEKRIVTYNPKLAKKQLSEIAREVEKARGLRLAKAKRSEYGDSAKFVSFTPVDAQGELIEACVVATLNHAAIDKAKRCAGYNMIVTSETDMDARAVYATYHSLWRIEESFKTMKSQLDARPVFLQRQDTIKGHFLVCYLAVLLERILQFKVLKGAYSTEDIMGMIKNYRIVEISDRRYVNISRSSALLCELEKKMGIPLTNYYLTKTQVDSIINAKF